jgi:type I site-specific restriction endonuclease
MDTEADTCRRFVVPKLQAAGWDADLHSIAQQRGFTDGRIVVRGNSPERKHLPDVLKVRPISDHGNANERTYWHRVKNLHVSSE